MDNHFTFPTLKYERPDFAAFQAQLAAQTDKLKNASSYEEAKAAYMDLDQHSMKLTSIATIASIRHTIDTTDEFYEKENEYIEHTYPEIMPGIIAFNDALYESHFRADFEKEFGKQMFTQMELQKKSFTEKNIPLLQRESQLSDEYQKILATAEIPFKGETLNIYGILKHFEDDDRQDRRTACKAYSDFFHANEPRLEEIWDELIANRNEQGRNLGYDNYLPVGYMKQGRTDYGYKEVAAFRKQVETELVPFCAELYKAQAKRIGVDEIHAYDEKRIFADGNAQPSGDDDFMIAQAKKMYHAMSPETAEFIDFMTEHELLDLKNKPHKAATGYMTSLNDLKAPFVYSVFNGTTGDMQVLSHELGHAFAGYMAMRKQPIETYFDESTDIAEIHSMSMEQFAYPYIENFFGKDADKYRFSHLQEAITFVPFGVAVDEFQHICYENPSLTPKQRTLEWKKLEEKYMPWRKYDADDFFDRGGYWYHKLHIFLYPFYYINYTLTTMGAMEFKKKDHENHAAAWADYLKLCECGGSLSYLETLKLANLSVPFEEGSVARAMSFAKEQLLDSMKNL